MSERRVRRLQNWLLALAFVVVFLGVAIPTAVIIYVNTQAEETQLAVACTSARANIAELTALSKFAHELGVPVTWTVPDLPSGC